MSPASDSPRTILVVDDDRDMQRFLAESFEREGWRVISERDGDWAVRSFERRHVDAVVLDILIPVMNGFQVAERIRRSERGKQVGILMLTGIYRGARHRAEAVERFGLLDYLDKPVDAERVVSVLKAHFATLPAAPRLAAKERTPAPARVRPTTASDDAVPEGTLVLRGNLKRKSFPALLAELYRGKRSGGLFLLKDKIKKIVYFREGHPVFIKSNVLDECLGRVLVRERMIAEEDCEESVRRMKRDRRQQGSVLIEMGVISPHNLRFGLELQLQVKLFDVFDWREGDYVFRDDVVAPTDVIGLDMSAAQIVVEGVRRAYHVDRLQKALSGRMNQFPGLAADPSQRFQELELTAGEQALVGKLDGTRTLQSILAALPPGLDAHGAMALVVALEAMGVIVVRTTAAAAPRALAFDGVPEVIAERDTLPSVRVELSPAGEPFSDAELGVLLAERRGQDAFTVLGVTASARSADLDRAYGQLLRELHPDRFRGRPPSSQALASEAFALVEAAYAELRDPLRRAAVEARLGRGGETGPVALPPIEQIVAEATGPNPIFDPATHALAGDRLHKDGLKELQAGAFAAAEQSFARAVELRPDMGLYRAALGWAMFLAGGRNATAAARALPVLGDACLLAPALEEPHLYRGLVHAELGQDDLAAPELEMAVQANPDSAEALRELRRIHAARARRREDSKDA